MIFILNKHCPLYGLKSKKQLVEILGITDKKLLKGKAQDKVNVYIATDPKERLIEAPTPVTKKAQGKIKNCLMKCDFPSYVFSGIRGKSYFNNAVIHKNCSFLYKTDISAFFPNISRNAVYNFFLKDLNTSPDVAKILTDICTVDISNAIEKDIKVANFIRNKKIRMHNHLCTGSPASPLLSYLANRKMFDEIHNIATNNNLTFSIYMDDIFFSSSKQISYNIRQHILSKLTKYGYNISFKKAIYYLNTDNKKVTGVIISPKNELKIPNKLKRKVVNGFSNGKLKISKKSLQGMLIASRLIENNSFNGIRKYLEEKEI